MSKRGGAMKVMMDGKEVEPAEWGVAEKWVKEWQEGAREFALLRRSSPIWSCAETGVPLPEYRFAELESGAWEARPIVLIILAERMLNLAAAAGAS